MKKTIICNIPMKEKVDMSVYKSDDKSLPVSEKSVRYPINSFLHRTMNPEDELKVILLVKKDDKKHYMKNTDDYISELNEINADIKAKLEYLTIETDFDESRSVHEKLLSDIVNALDDESHILADITYGPKDLPVVLFTALNFAEKFMNCSVDNIIYGQASFENGRVVETKICDMVPLFCLGSVTNMINCSDSKKAKEMLNNLLDI